MSYKILVVGSLILLTLGLSIAVVDAQRPPPGGRRSPAALTGTGFTYQGQLKNNDALVNGSCDFEFGLWDDPTVGPQYGATQTVSSLAVTNGLFTTQIDFGSVFTGTARYLQSAVRCPSGVGITTTLSPRQALTPAPYALALPGLYTQQNSYSPNVIGGYSGNVITPTLVAATISGGGAPAAYCGSFACPNRAWANFATIGGGIGNTASGQNATIGGGYVNTANGTGAFVGGGGYDGTFTFGNTATGNASTIGGGLRNTIPITGTYATIGGGRYNTASGLNATIGGGFLITVSGAYGTVGGGDNNTASVSNTTIGGGSFNIASGVDATIGGGYNNTASGSDLSTVGGGAFNTANGLGATVAGGGNNTASGVGATVAGGSSNTASGDYATIPGGRGNTAAISDTLAAGRFANAIHQGAFVWADCNPCSGGGLTFSSSADNQFLIRANGGVGMTDSGASVNTAAQLDVSSSGNSSKHQIRIDQRNSGDNARLRFNVSGAVSSWDIAVGDATTNVMNFYNGGNIMTLSAIGNPITTSVGAYLSAGGTWTNASDKSAKENFADVNGQNILTRLSSVPIQSWNYKKEDASIRHIGPMAQDFYAAFGIGADDKSISTVDEGGVALAAIQGLCQVVQEKEAKITSQQKQIDALEARVAALEQGSTKTRTPANDWDAALALVVGAVGVVMFERARRGGAG